ncbi:MAG: iron-sulfur cluster assembly scaffold protein [Candidatus Omnitrophota bacterium]|nr:iron-sulfur cluster assembly scaffold protein [Candidatus Omnitrophota bacterium]MBU1928640.1 iron-sulfur cluster assembly scaffold protein [Candidatus Omnitrophota bacterium]MBU2034742.1 iron-sulfur cluster assembly scaffold protein [Candidatus Omnitrophota bacterium]MBU2222082.1 iron-sulfur cluster assembly scaffold protein [Candidatus Omnitrophota bacterium]MBU2257666.1 iron-sulfur cluster assembly scaffold protein [Candidatus Omnitrophota bacterium]
MDKQTDWLYTDKVKDHFIHPRNLLMDESKYEADGRGVIGNIKCGDEMVVVIKVDKEKGVITDLKWKTYGCASAIASTSVLSELAIGKTLDQAYKLSSHDIALALDGLPEHKIHCSVLGDKALRAAIDDYYTRQGMTDKVKEEKEHVICQCLGITDAEIESAVLEGARNYYQLQERTKIGTVCGKCKDKSVELLEAYKKKYFKDS